MQERNIHLAKEDLIIAIEIGGIEEGDTAVNSVVDERNHVFFGLGGAIEGGHAHTSQPLLGHFQALRAQLRSRYFERRSHISLQKRWMVDDSNFCL